MDGHVSLLLYLLGWHCLKIIQVYSSVYYFIFWCFGLSAHCHSINPVDWGKNYLFGSFNLSATKTGSDHLSEVSCNNTQGNKEARPCQPANVQAAVNFRVQFSTARAPWDSEAQELMVPHSVCHRWVDIVYSFSIYRSWHFSLTPSL